MFDYKQAVELGDYLPCHDEADNDHRLEELNGAVECAIDNRGPNEDGEDLYSVRGK